MKKVLLVLIMLFHLQIGYSQAEDPSVKTVEGIVNRMIEIISGDIDEQRDWDAYRNLFLPTAQKIILNPKAKNPANKVRAMNISEFIKYVGPQYKENGFLEIEIGLTINEYNGVANVFQSYHAKTIRGEYDKKGINSYQLVYLNDRWWISSTTWATETPENKIPNRFLKETYRSKN